MPSRNPPVAVHDSLDDAEAEVARAEAAAAAARARAVELRRQAERAIGGHADTVGGPPRPRRRWLRRPPWKSVAVGTVLVLSVALFGASGAMWWHHRAAVQDRQRMVQFAAAARRCAADLMSIDFNTAQQGVQRVIDDSTGQFKGQYQGSAKQLVKAMQDGKVVTKVTVDAVAVESMSRDSANVLVAATTERHNAQDPTNRPATWRMTITLDTDRGQPKMSKVEFLG